MANKRIDFTIMKLDFFQSEFVEVKAFIKDIGMTYSSYTRKYTAGWTKQKVDYNKKIVERALEAEEKKQAKSLEIDMGYLKKAKKNAVNILVGTL
jgi:IS30 family transposase